MKTRILISLAILFVGLVFSCESSVPQPKMIIQLVKVQPAPKGKLPRLKGFTNVRALSPTIKQDIRYATKNNFVGEVIYDCPSCYLRPQVALALDSVNTQLRAKGIGIKVFDCYRPLPAQQKLWDKVPNASYVTPPSRGSMHNRGMAIDLTIYDIKKMRELWMGSGYDFFGPKAHTDYPLLTTKVRQNRDILYNAMTAHGFKGIRTEWWHYYYAGSLDSLSSVEWKCLKNN